MENTYDPLIWLGTLADSIPYGGIIYTILAFIIVLGVLVYVHEWGHFKAAKSVGIKVEEFAVGFGPALYRWQDKFGTNWKVGAIPLGGYVQMKGQVDGQAVTASKAKDSFANKTVLQRAWVIFAGPFANFVLAAIVFTFAMWLGETKLAPTISGVQQDSPAEIAGFQTGDTVTLINDTAITTWEEMQTTIQNSGGAELQVIVARGDTLVPLTLVPNVVEQKDILGYIQAVGRIGVLAAGETVQIQHGWIGGIGQGIYKTWDVTSLVFRSLWSLLTGRVSTDNLAGPLGIADLAGQSAKVGVAALLLFMGVISVNLGIVNLLPIPVLDGGHLVFLAYEGVTGKQASEAVQDWGIKIGLGLILLLVIFSTKNDIYRFIDRGADVTPEVVIEDAAKSTQSVDNPVAK